MADRSFSDDDLRLYDLLQQFLSLSNSTEHGGTLILISPKGSIVGDCTLAPEDLVAATDALLKLNIQRANQAAGVDTSDELPEVDEQEVAAMISALQDLADGDA
ncbi:hypothetical protein [Streptomyces violaceus]|uniref:Roadblock/LAMTOR2 domain-containing protein n=1 Tax=Streptomyces violaceus TaxID=1936 RepID=A0ABY9UPF5_STRVL|nr:hypothetical protein [Streptomyces janthinus]WND24086.1 hypothetical protein RI060_42975 [Streptomyces janthinus]GGS96298.1 hypothetical protein GCM10010270_80320 [Streptomyces janthinus]